MKTILAPLLAYLLVCLLAIVAPASDSYDTISWKLLVGQLYAIPVLIVVLFITYFVKKKRLNKVIKG
ncbi:DUF4017 family protein [Rummeliibacillus pycnus]|uniref:DUF4017 family protein n=1 Tax=Rummeliibacillus pycnus TaxID=101070 RepID=UPI000C9B6B50|nr:DUF4017 family protein [Rummeliibacillus pycnus]